MATHEARKASDAQIRTGLNPEGADEIAKHLRGLLADVFALYLKTKHFHWHMPGRHFREYHPLFDEHADQIFAMTDKIAERARRSAPRHSAPSAILRGIRQSYRELDRRTGRCSEREKRTTISL